MSHGAIQKIKVASFFWNTVYIYSKSIGMRGKLLVVFVVTCSSDDDIDAILRSTAGARHRAKRSRELREEESTSEDEFEKEMASELNAKMKKIERQWATGHYVP